jgi:hypothetical protein
MIDDDELLLYHYREHPDPDLVRAALAQSPELRRRLDAVRADLALLQPSTVLPPDSSVRRWRNAVRGARRGAAWRVPLAAAALLLIGIGVGRFAGEPAPTDTVAAAPNRGTLMFLADTRQHLASWPDARSERRALIADIVADNRLHALAAERSGDPQLARVLRAFEPVLLALDGDSPEAVAGARAQLDFEARAMQTKLRAASSNAVQRL